MSYVDPFSELQTVFARPTHETIEFGTYYLINLKKKKTLLSITFLLPHMNSQPEGNWPILSFKAVTKNSPLSERLRLSTTTVPGS